MAERKYRILYTTADGQEKLKDVIKKYLPDERGSVFLPKVEYYRRDRQCVEEKALLPGYVFLHTDLDLYEIHAFLKKYTREACINARELGFLRREGDLEIADVTKEEERFLDFIRCHEGILKMSDGYYENKTCVVMNGPLQDLRQYITKVDRHNRRAFLDIEFRNCRMWAGLEIKPKRFYFPDDPNAPEILSDGTEADVIKIAKKMMQG